MRFIYRCGDCGHEFESDDVVYLCPKCGGSEKAGEFRKGILSVILDPDGLKALRDRKDLCVEDFMPYPIVHPETFPCGPTPLVKPLRLRKETGVDLTLKMDSQLLSGSFKDRASLLVASQAIHHGQDRIALASTGTNWRWPPEEAPLPPGSCTECVASKTTGACVSRMIASPRMSLTRLP